MATTCLATRRRGDLFPFPALPPAESDVEARRRASAGAARLLWGASAHRHAGSPLAALFSPIENARIKLRLTPVLGRQGDETVVRLLLYIDTEGLAFSESAGVWHAGMDVSGRTVDATGRVVAATNWRYAIRAGSAELSELREHGLLYRNQLTIKRPGYYRIMIAVRDVDSGTTGTASQVLDVPDFEGGAFGLSGLLARGDAVREPTCGRNPSERTPLSCRNPPCACSRQGLRSRTRWKRQSAVDGAFATRAAAFSRTAAAA